MGPDGREEHVAENSSEVCCTAPSCHPLVRVVPLEECPLPCQPCLDRHTFCDVLLTAAHDRDEPAAQADHTTRQNVTRIRTGVHQVYLGQHAYRALSCNGW